jgi:hypothetical protein
MKTPSTSPRLSPALIVERRQALKTMMERTLRSLLRCYRPGTAKFFGVRGNALARNATFRDTAAVLTAIETSGVRLMNQAATAALPGAAHTPAEHAAAAVSFVSTLADDRSVPYAEYRRHIFDPAAARIVSINSDAGEPLDYEKESLPGTGHDRKLDAFSGSVILRFLTHYQKDRSHGAVYAETAKSVVDALSQLAPPQRQFGGASLTATEPNAFVSHSCIKALRSIVDSLRRRASEHARLAAILARSSSGTRPRTRTSGSNTRIPPTSPRAWAISSRRSRRRSKSASWCRRSGARSHGSTAARRRRCRRSTAPWTSRGSTGTSRSS